MDFKTEYWSLLESTQRQWYPGFIGQLSSQVGARREEGRAAVITFQDGNKPAARTFETSRALRRYFTNSSTLASPNGPALRRMFVLEGLPRNFIEVLGSELRIPPSLFAAHWSSFSSFVGSLLNQTPRHYDHHNHFILSFPKLHMIKIQGKESDDDDPVYFMQSNINRQLTRLTLFGDFEDPFWSSEKVSFWSTSQGQSWDAVLLVDPPLGNFVMWTDDPVPRTVVHDTPEKDKPPERTKSSVSQDGSWYAPFPLDSAEQAPEMRSVFEDILRLYPTRQRQSSVDPMSASDICRQLVLSAWTAGLRIHESQVIRKQYQMSVGPGSTTFNPRTWLDRSWTHPWTERDFGRLVRAKSTLESIDTSLFYNMDALGMCGNSPVGEEREGQSWKSLRSAVQTLKTRVNMVSEVYMQAISVRESIVANTQARQVGYLTALATLFIPLSFVAAVFSMGGDFAAGQKRFYVFWAISLPITLTVLGVYFSGAWILNLLRDFYGTLKVKEEKHIV